MLQLESIEIKSLEEEKNTTDSYPNWSDKKSLKTFQVLLTATPLITGIKQLNSSILTLKTWLIKLGIFNYTISEISAKKGFNTLNEIKNAGITTATKKHAPLNRKI